MDNEEPIKPGTFTINVSSDLIPTGVFGSWESDGSGNWVGTVPEADIPLRISGWFVEPLAGRSDLVVATRVEPDETGSPVLAELRVFPSKWVEAGPVGAWGLFARPPHNVEGITARALRRVSIRRPLEDTKKIVLKFVDEIPDSPAEQLLLGMGWSAEALVEAFREAPRRPGRRGRSDAYYVPLASAYAGLVAAGNHKPIATLAAELGLKPAQVRDLIHTCRVRGLLTKGTRGVAEGALTDKAHALLEELKGDDDGQHP